MGTTSPSPERPPKVSQLQLRSPPALRAFPPLHPQPGAGIPGAEGSGAARREPWGSDAASGEPQTNTACEERLTICPPGEEQCHAQCQGCGGGGHAGSASSAGAVLGEQGVELCSGRLPKACFSPGGWLSDVSEALAQREESSSVATSTFLYCPPTQPQLMSQPGLGISYKQP